MNPDEIPLHIAIPLIVILWATVIGLWIADGRERVRRMLEGFDDE